MSDGVTMQFREKTVWLVLAITALCLVALFVAISVAMDLQGENTRQQQTIEALEAKIYELEGYPGAFVIEIIYTADLTHIAAQVIEAADDEQLRGLELEERIEFVMKKLSDQTERFINKALATGSFDSTEEKFTELRRQLGED